MGLAGCTQAPRTGPELRVFPAGPTTGPGVTGGSDPYEGSEREKSLAVLILRQGVDDFVEGLTILGRNGTFPTYRPVGVSFIDQFAADIIKDDTRYDLAKEIGLSPAVLVAATLAGKSPIEVLKPPAAVTDPDREAQTSTQVGAKIFVATRVNRYSRAEARQLACHEILHQGIAASLAPRVPVPLVRGAVISGFASAEVFIDQICAVLVSAIDVVLPETGRLDPSFGVNGVFTWNKGLPWCRGRRLIRLESGDLVAAGFCSDGKASLVKMSDRGEIDTEWGMKNGGSGCGRPAGPTNEVFGIAETASGKFLLGGHSSINDHTYAFTCSFNADGKVNSSWGSTENPGLVGLDADCKCNSRWGDLSSADGNHYVTTSLDAFPGVAEYNSRIALFRPPTKLTPTELLQISGTAVELVARAIPLPGGGFAAAGRFTDTTGPTRAFVARWNDAENFETTFGSKGYAFLPSTGDNDEFRDLAVSDGGNLLAAGYSGAGKVLLASFRPDGSPNTDFNLTGTLKLTPPAGKKYEVYRSLVIDDKHRILVAANEISGSEAQGTPVLWRLLADGTLDPTFAAVQPVRLPFPAQILDVVFDGKRYLFVGTAGDRPTTAHPAPTNSLIVFPVFR